MGRGWAILRDPQGPDEGMPSGLWMDRGAGALLRGFSWCKSLGQRLIVLGFHSFKESLGCSARCQDNMSGTLQLYNVEPSDRGGRCQI